MISNFIHFVNYLCKIISYHPIILLSLCPATLSPKNGLKYDRKSENSKDAYIYQLNKQNIHLKSKLAKYESGEVLSKKNRK